MCYDLVSVQPLQARILWKQLNGLDCMVPFIVGSSYIMFKEILLFPEIKVLPSGTLSQFQFSWLDRPDVKVKNHGLGQYGARRRTQLFYVTVLATLCIKGLRCIKI